MNDASVAPGVTVSVDALSQLLLDLYASSLNSTTPTGFLRQVCVQINAFSGAALIWEQATGRARHLDFLLDSPQPALEYKATYAADDPIRIALLDLPPRRFYLCHEMIDGETLRSHPYFTKWYAERGFGDVCAGRIPIGEHHNCNLGFVRVAGTAPFGRAELDFLDQLLPHIEHNLLIHNLLDRLKLYSDVAQQNLVQAGAGFIVLNGSGRINYMNRIARTMLETNPVLREHNGELRILDAPSQQRFSALVTECVAAAQHVSVLTGGAVAIPRPGQTALSAMVFPYRSQGGPLGYTSQDSRATVTLFDPARPRLDPPEILRQLYGLSDSEVQLCWRLANGESLGEVARAMSLGKETVRSQLKRAFTKTGTRRQSDLVRLVLTGPAQWVAGPGIAPNPPA